MRMNATDNDLFDALRLLHDLSTPIDDVVERLVLGTKQRTKRGIIRSVPTREVIYCSAPKCGTTNWQRGMQVLLQTERQQQLPPDERIVPRPEDFAPAQLFKFSSKRPDSERPEVFPDSWSKIWAGRDPFARVYSAWRD